MATRRNKNRNRNKTGKIRTQGRRVQRRTRNRRGGDAEKECIGKLYKIENLKCNQIIPRRGSTCHNIVYQNKGDRTIYFCRKPDFFE